MLSESVLIAIFAFIVLMCHDHRKWRKTFTHSLSESTANGADLLSQATESINFIADMVDEGSSPLASPPKQGPVGFDPQSLITQLIMNKMGMSSEHASEEQIRSVQETQVEPPQ
jgi:hypothetical protein